MSAAPCLHLLCAGAAQGLVKALQPALAPWATLDAQFGAVGALREALLAGAPCDVMITTQTMLGELISSAALHATGAAKLGRVATGLAACRGAPHPPVATRAQLQAALQAAQAVYFPDAQRSTAGIHFSQVLDQLGLAQTLAARLRTFPNGATAMRELALSANAAALGCTQISEILYTEGVELVAPLPPGFELATVYSAAASSSCTQLELAERFIGMLTAPAAAALRHGAGFED